MHFHAGGTAKSEFEKRAAYISTEESHVFHPVMERCLEQHPQARGTFEEVIVHLKKYSKSKPDEVNMQEIDQQYINDLLYQYLCIITYPYIHCIMQRGIERQRSQLLQLQRDHDNMQVNCFFEHIIVYIHC